jgi:hypothetical protein
MHIIVRLIMRRTSTSKRMVLLSDTSVMLLVMSGEGDVDLDCKNVERYCS